jgi:hypothetical protein
MAYRTSNGAFGKAAAAKSSGKRISLSTPVDHGSDQEVVETMTRRVDQLVDRIAAALQTVSLAEATR